jgi:hypothetical protein
MGDYCSEQRKCCNEDGSERMSVEKAGLGNFWLRDYTLFRVDLGTDFPRS